MLLDLVNRISSERKVKKKLDIQVWVLSRFSRGRPENVLGTSRMNLPGTSLERQIKTSPGRHFRTSPGRQIETSPGRSKRIFRGRPEDVGGGRPGDVLGTNICRIGSNSNQSVQKCFSDIYYTQLISGNLQLSQWQTSLKLHSVTKNLF